MLKSCLSLSDALAIRELDVDVFKKIFVNVIVYFWKSVVRYNNNRLLVLCLYAHNGEVALRWHWLGNVWYDYMPALRFK